MGYVFATILWDMTWLLIEKEGFDPDFYRGKGGNNIAMTLVIEGLKNTASNPGFVSGRNGILQADKDLYGGKYKCLIWKAFASRGVGINAVENKNGGTNSNDDQVVSYKNPCSEDDHTPTPIQCANTVTSFPYKESFESGFGLWKNSRQGDQLDFTRNTGRTPSNGTGPTQAANGRYYVYVEASGNATPSKKAMLTSPCFNFSSLSSPTLSFNYHMYGTNIASLIIEAKGRNGSWSKVFERQGNKGDKWFTGKVDLRAYARQANVQIRMNVVTGTGTNGWRSDIAIDNITITNNVSSGGGGCKAINFNNHRVSSFADQDTNGRYYIRNSGLSLVLNNNTWKSIPMNYRVTQNTVIEFEFSSTSQGEIHGIGFENDNIATPNRYFKIDGTQNYGITNYDNYRSGIKKYFIRVGRSYTGNMNRLVFINDKDNGSGGNNSTFNNVKVYEGSCGGVSYLLTENTEKHVDIIGNENEAIFTTVSLVPNPVNSGGRLLLRSSSGILKDTSYRVLNMLGQVMQVGKLTGNVIDVGKLKAGVYILSFENQYTNGYKRFVIK